MTSEFEVKSSVEWYRVTWRRLPLSSRAEDEITYGEWLWRLRNEYVATDDTSCVLLGGHLSKWLHVRVPVKSRLGLATLDDAALDLLEEIPIDDLPELDG